MCDLNENTFTEKFSDNYNILEDLQESSSMKSCDYLSDVEVEPASTVIKSTKETKNYPPNIITSLEGKQFLYSCTVCNKSFKTKSHRRFHIYCLDGNKPFKCLLCGKSFVTKFHFNYHMRTHTGETPFKCSFCDKSFKEKDKVKRHEKIHTATKVNCHICNKELSNQSSLNLHISVQHKDVRFKCFICNKTYGDKGSLNRHKMIHTGQKDFVCESCGKKFHRKSGLMNHLNCHIIERAFKCNTCTKAFKNKAELVRHKLIHTEAADYECITCNVTFRRKDNMLRHIRNTHPEIAITSDKYKLIRRSGSVITTNVNRSNCVIMHTSAITQSSLSPRESVIKYNHSLSV